MLEVTLHHTNWSRFGSHPASVVILALLSSASVVTAPLMIVLVIHIGSGTMQDGRSGRTTQRADPSQTGARPLRTNRYNGCLVAAGDLVDKK